MNLLIGSCFMIRSKNFAHSEYLYFCSTTHFFLQAFSYPMLAYIGGSAFFSNVHHIGDLHNVAPDSNLTQCYHSCNSTLVSFYSPHILDDQQLCRVDSFLQHALWEFGLTLPNQYHTAKLILRVKTPVFLIGRWIQSIKFSLGLISSNSRFYQLRRQILEMIDFFAWSLLQ